VEKSIVGIKSALLKRKKCTSGRNENGVGSKKTHVREEQEDEKRKMGEKR
jgi:hypothetical protein